MIRLENLRIDRAIVHQIVEKQIGQDQATVNPRNSLITLNADVRALVNKRLIEAAGKESKAFELRIAQDGVGSFFECSADLCGNSDADFVESSKNVARLLARSQRRTKIPGGYLVVIGGTETGSNLRARLVIKAEPHEVLQYTTGKVDQLNLLKDVFLSPEQKLFKIGIIYEKAANNGAEVNERFGAFLYDDQFRQDDTPAAYFYRDFLGFDVSENAKIQTKKFFELTKSFIERNVNAREDRVAFISALRNEFVANQAATIDPLEFGVRLFENDVDVHDSYIREICEELPNAIVKDATLINSQLRRRQMSFTGKVSLVGPEETFDQHITIVDSEEELRELDPSSEDYTLIKIQGKPYTSNE